MSTSRRVALVLLIVLDVGALLLWWRARPEVAIAVADAASHSDATTFALEDGLVRADLGVRHDALAVAPVVPTRWTADAPIPMWAATAPGSPPLPGTVTRAVAVAPDVVSRYRPLIAEAEQRYGIHGEVGAPIVFLERVDASSASSAAWMLNVLIGMNVVLAAFALVNRDRRPA